MAESYGNTLRCALRLFFMLTIMTGVIYPLSITILAQLLFPWAANGSLLSKNGVPVGSQLIGQAFTSATYFWGRPSAITSAPNAALSGASNLGPNNPQLLTLIQARVQHWQHADQDTHTLLPVDLVTASASGLDPDISPEAAFYQVNRIAKVRHITQDALTQLITQQIQPRELGLLGEPRVNVLLLNLALDEFSTTHRKR